MTKNEKQVVDIEKPEPLIWLIGLGLVDPLIWKAKLAPELQQLLFTADVLIGGKKQLKPFYNDFQEQIVLDSSLEMVLAKMRNNHQLGKKQVVLCSGDPLFFGLGNAVVQAFGMEDVLVVPGISSAQGAAARLGLPWHQAVFISLHGRDSKLPLAQALLTKKPIIVLTDAVFSLHETAYFLEERGFEDYRMHFFEWFQPGSMGQIYTAAEYSCTVSEALGKSDQALQPRVFVLLPPEWNAQAVESGGQDGGNTVSSDSLTAFGLNDALLKCENNLMTKGPVRAFAMAALRIAPEHTVWDLGGGSGCVGIEASRLAWRGQVVSVEKNPSRILLMRQNRKRFKAANLEIFQGNFPECLPCLPLPQRIFIGGGLGGTAEEAQEVLRVCWEVLPSGGRLAAHCVLFDTLERCRTFLKTLSVPCDLFLLQSNCAVPLGASVRLEAFNPVFLLVAEKTVA